MLILGLLLLGCTAAFTGLALADNLNGGPDYNVTILGHHLATMNSLAIFCAGLALALIFCLGAMMVRGGMALHRRKSRKLAAARRDAAETARERDALAARLENTTTTAPTDPDYPTSADPYPSSYDTAADAEPTPDDSPHPATPESKPRRHPRHLFGH
ncbi:hypothetical protein ACFO3J_13285 [Streptomyces polygonati]|uniref:LapA family protein n=1 Tax=Streptomyces polygonati TaxID=1617087 RepID=A0ABV8HLH2_9ACTN